MDLKNRLLLVVFLFLIVISSIFFAVKFIGFAINTPSRVTIAPQVVVNASSFDGSSTNLSNMSNEQLSNINGMVLEKAEYGKIIFLESIDLTVDAENWFADINGNVNISNNYIEINTSKLTSLEKPALLYLYNLSFSNPRMMRNGNVCPDSICEKISYSSGILIFSVTSFTSYSAEETPEANETPGASASGGGGGGGLLIKNFSVNNDLIKVSMKQGESAKEYLIIKNTGNTEINIRIEISKLERFIILSDENFVLKAQESKILGIDLFAKENEIADSYLGKIIITSGEIKKAVSVILEIKARNPLFDIKTEILNKLVRPGDKVRAQIKVNNMGDLKHIDIILYMAIISLDGEIVDYKEESLAIENELIINRSMDLPKLVDGKYIFYSRVSYQNITASSSEVFEVSISAPTTEINKNAILAAIVLVLIISWIVYYRKQMRFRKRHIKLKVASYVMEMSRELFDQQVYSGLSKVQKKIMLKNYILRYGKRSPFETAMAVFAMIGLLGATFIFSSNFTGNVINSSINSVSNWIGVVLFVVGLVGAFVYLRRKLNK